jgi:hypothetical protein
VIDRRELRRKSMLRQHDSGEDHDAEKAERFS